VRLVLSIITFVAAGVMLAIGIVVRLAPVTPWHDFAVETSGTAPLTVISGAVLNELDGNQTVTVDGQERVTVAYARTGDVMAWVGNASYNEISFRTPDGGDCTPDPADQSACGLVSTPHAGKETSVPDPYGGDLWLEDDCKGSTCPISTDPELRMTGHLGSEVSLLVAADGTAPAPSAISLSWPKPADLSRDIAEWLIIVGAVLGVIGLILLFSAIYRIRNEHGPRRRMPKVPKRKTIKSVRSPRMASRIGGGLVLIGLLAAAVPLAQPDGASAATSGTSATVPAATERQIDTVVRRLVTAITTADQANDTTLAATRLTGPALELKTADYALRSKDASLAASSPTIPSDGSVVLRLPQQVSADAPTWPRTVFAVLAQPEALASSSPSSTSSPATAAPIVAPLGLVLTQAGPRDNYKAAYLVELQSDIPDVPPADRGTAVVPASSPLVEHPIEWLTPAYVDVLAKGDQSPYYAEFDLTQDRLLQGFGVAAQQAQSADQTADPPNRFAFSTVAGAGPIIALATTNNGAIVSGTVRQTAEVTPGEDGAKVIATGEVSLLSGVERSSRGYRTTYAGQVLYYLPPLGSPASVVVLGYAAGIVSSQEKP